MFDFAQRFTNNKFAFRVLCGAIVSVDEKILLVQESSKRIHGRWSLPAGLIEYGENIFEATKREVKEETGLDVDMRGLVGVYNWYSELNKSAEAYYIFLADNVRGVVDSHSDEILAVKAFSFQEIIEMPDESFSNPHFRQVIKDYRRGKLYPLEVISVL